MTDAKETEARRLEFDATAPETWLQRLRSALRDPGEGALVIDMGRVGYAGPAALGALQAAADEADAAGRELWLDHVPAQVYKTLQVARLARRFQRVHHGVDSLSGQ